MSGQLTGPWPGYLDQHCALCFEKPVRYVKTKGSFHKICDRCRKVLSDAGLVVEDARVVALVSADEQKGGA